MSVQRDTLLVHTKHLEITHLPRDIPPETMEVMIKGIFPYGVETVSMRGGWFVCGDTAASTCVMKILPWLSPKHIDLDILLFSQHHDALIALPLETLHLRMTFRDKFFEAIDNHRLAHAVSEAKLIRLTIVTRRQSHREFVQNVAECIASRVRATDNTWEMHISDMFAPLVYPFRPRPGVFRRDDVPIGFDLAAAIVKQIGNKKKSDKVTFVNQAVKPIQAYAKVIEDRLDIMRLLPGDERPGLGFYGSWTT